MVVVIFALILIGAGFIAEKIFSLISRCEGCCISSGLAFALLIFIINTVGMYYARGMVKFSILEDYMNYWFYSTKYALVSIAVAIVLGTIGGIIGRVICGHKCKSYHKISE